MCGGYRATAGKREIGIGALGDMDRVLHRMGEESLIHFLRR
jgi:hypothetical protein